MKHEERLLWAMGSLEEAYLMEAWNYQGKARRRIKRGLILVAAVMTVLALGATAVAANQSWQETIRGWFGVSEDGVGGYEEYTDKTVTFDGLNIRQLSTLCSGNELVTFFEVTPAEGEVLDLGMGLELQLQLMDEQEPLLDGYTLETVSESEQDILMKLTVSFSDISGWESLPVRFYHPAGHYAEEFSEVMTLEILDTPVLAAEPNIPIRNEIADADGVIRAIQLCSGSLEILVDREITEHWCNRVCVPDGGARFCKAYYGEDWESSGVREEPALFSREDEIAIFQGYGDSWRDEVQSMLETVRIIRKDGTELQITGEPFIRNRSDVAAMMDGYEYDTDVYRYTILPLVDLEEIASVEFMGKPLELELRGSAQ